MDEEEERHLGDWLRSAAGDCGVAKFYETLVILPPTTKQIRHHSLSLSLSLSISRFCHHCICLGNHNSHEFDI